MSGLRHRVQIAPDLEMGGQGVDQVLLALLEDVEAPRQRPRAHALGYPISGLEDSRLRESLVADGCVISDRSS